MPIVFARAVMGFAKSLTHPTSWRCPLLGTERTCRIRFLMRSALRYSAPRGHGAAHGAVPRGRVTAGDGGGLDDAGMRRAQKHMSLSGGRRST